MADSVSYLRYGVALLLVLGLVVLASAVFRVFGARRFGVNIGSTRKIQLVEQLWLDARYRAVRLHYNDKEYFMVLGPEKAEILEQDFFDDSAPAPSHRQKLVSRKPQKLDSGFRRNDKLE